MLFTLYDNNIEAIRKGYIVDNLHYNCFIKEGYDIKPIEYNFDNHTNLQGVFSIASYNIWGIDRSDAQKYLIEKRMPLIIKEIKDNNIDIVCFQEMSYTAFTILSQSLDMYNIY